jgi:NAD(P)-dependent dehydrogenase (short-subunit alcohol dehydrogenase family)
VTGSLAGKVALVAGASRGIGRAIAAGLAGRGANVYAVARDRGRLSELAAEPSGCGRITAVPADLLTPGIEDVLRRQVPAVDIVVFVAAAPLRHASLLETGEEAWHEQWALNVDLPRRLIGWAAPLMRSRGGGSFVFISTVAAQRPLTGLGAYSVGKAALDALMRCAALELGSSGIRCNSVAPGLVHTERTDELIAATPLAEQHRQTTPLGELTTPAGVADIVAWLACDQAQSLTGQVLVADGGRSVGTFRAAG